MLTTLTFALLLSTPLAQDSPATAPATTRPAASQPVLAGPPAEEDDAGKLTLVQRSFDGRVERVGPEPDVVAVSMLDLSAEQRAAYEEIRSARMTTFDQIVRGNYGLILELASIQGEPDLGKRANVVRRVQTALKPFTDRGTFYQEMWPHLTDPQRTAVETMLEEYREAMKADMAREGSGDPVRRSQYVRERMETFGEMVRESIERQIGLEREHFEQIAAELELTAEQKNKAEAIFQPLAIKRFQNIPVTRHEQSAAFAEFNKLLTAGQKQRLFAMLLRRYQQKTTAPAATGPAQSQPATQPAMPD